MGGEDPPMGCGDDAGGVDLDALLKAARGALAGGEAVGEDE